MAPSGTIALEPKQKRARRSKEQEETSSTGPSAFANPTTLVVRARQYEKGIREDRKNLNDLVPLLELTKVG